MGHNMHNRLRDCWTRAKQFFTPFLPHYHFLHILRYWHFTYNEKEIDRNDENYYRLWKIREIFYVFDVAFSKFCNPYEHLAFDEVIVLFKGKVVFKQYIFQTQ
jgi:hypothetical protein